MEFLFFLAAAFSFVVTVIWLVIGWRAMLAHESLAKAASRFVARQEVDRAASIRSAAISDKQLYKQFINEAPKRADLPAKERHEAFRVWREENPSAEAE